MPGPLEGVTVLEMVGIGPGPYAGMLMADMGAKVIAVERVGTGPGLIARDIIRRGKTFISINTKTPEGRDLVLDLAKQADALIEGFRPGVMERLGLGPEAMMAQNPKLVYGRMTGWGQNGPLAERAGHDINYIAVSGALGGMGPADGPPTPPLNLVGDLGGGSLFLVSGLLAGMLSAARTGNGQVVDAAMVDGSSHLMSMFHAFAASGGWPMPRGQNLLDGGAPFYGSYETSDGRYMAAGPIEPQFAMQFYQILGLDALMADHMSMPKWAENKEKVALRFKEKTAAEWAAKFDGTDACVAEIIPFQEAAKHPHMKARKAFFEAEGISQPAPAPRFSETPSPINANLPKAGSGTDAVMAMLGYKAEAIQALRDSKVID